jgi:tRNA (cmo5U34)-methyltransferase
MYRYPDVDGIDKPSHLLDQLKWLEQAGFAEVDVFWMQAGHALFGGRKR